MLCSCIERRHQQQHSPPRPHWTRILEDMAPSRPPPPRLSGLESRSDTVSRPQLRVKPLFRALDAARLWHGSIKALVLAPDWSRRERHIPLERRRAYSFPTTAIQVPRTNKQNHRDQGMFLSSRGDGLGRVIVREALESDVGGHGSPYRAGGFI